MPAEKVLSIPSPIVNMKATKNSVEVAGIKKAHIRDAIALCQLWYEIEKDVSIKFVFTNRIVAMNRLM